MVASVSSMKNCVMHAENYHTVSGGVDHTVGLEFVLIYTLMALIKTKTQKATNYRSN